MTSKDLNFEDITVGQTASFEVAITAEQVDAFAALSGDTNPLHTDEGYAGKSEFKGRVVHGMFLAALVSRLVGMELPGTRALLVKEQLEFKHPARIGDMVRVQGTVAHKSDAGRLLEIAIQISAAGTLLATGTVWAQVRT